MADEIKVEVTAPAEPVTEVVAPATPSPSAQMHDMAEVLKVARDLLQIDAIMGALARSSDGDKYVVDAIEGLRTEVRELREAVGTMTVATAIAAEAAAEQVADEVQAADEIQDAENVREAVGTALEETGAAAEEVGQTPLAESVKKRGRAWL